MGTQGGPAKAIVTQVGGRQQSGPAIPVVAVTDGRPIEGGPAQVVYIVTSGPVQAGPALPVVLATGAQAQRVAAGAAIPVYVVGGTLNPPMSALVDNFNDNVRSTDLWTNNVLFMTALVAVSETGGQLVIQAANSTPGTNYGGYASRLVYNLTGTSAAVQVPLAATGSTTDTQLILYIDNNNYLVIYKEGATIYFDVVIGGVTTSVSTPYNSTNHAWWRIRHVTSDDTIRWDTSPDGSVWTQQRSRARPFAITGLRVDLSAGTYQSVAGPGPANFDNFNATP